MTLSESNYKNFQGTEKISIIAYFFCAGLSTSFTYFNTMVWLEHIDLPAIRKEWKDFLASCTYPIIYQF